MKIFIVLILTITVARAQQVITTLDNVKDPKKATILKDVNVDSKPTTTLRFPGNEALVFSGDTTKKKIATITWKDDVPVIPPVTPPVIPTLPVALSVISSGTGGTQSKSITLKGQPKVNFVYSLNPGGTPAQVTISFNGIVLWSGTLPASSSWADYKTHSVSLTKTGTGSGTLIVSASRGINFRSVTFTP